MVDMGTEPFLVASTVEAIMAQRLVRRLCKHCKEPVDLDKIELPSDFPRELVDSNTIYGPVGCRECRDVGYAGRVGIYELLVTTDSVRELAMERASTFAIKQAALTDGMRTLRDDAWLKTIAGQTSISEVTRVTKNDRREQAKS